MLFKLKLYIGIENFEEMFKKRFNIMRKNIIVLIFILILISVGLTQSHTSGLLKRNQIEDKYKWDTKDVYLNENEWKNDFEWIENNLYKYDSYKDKLSSSGENLVNCLEFDNLIKEKLGYLWLYAKLNLDVDMKNTTYQAMWSNYSILDKKVEVGRSFIKPEIISIPDKKIQRYIKGRKELKIYDHFFKTLLSKKDYTLSKDKEELLANASQLMDNSYNLFNTLIYAELPFPTIKNDKNETIQLNRSTSWRARSSSDRDYRKRGYEKYYNSLSNYKETLTKNLNNYIDTKLFISNTRGYENCLESALANYDIPVEIYENLINSVKMNLEPLHRWMKIKKELLELDTLHIYDLRTSVFQKIEKDISWEEGKNLTFESLQILDKDYLKYIENAYKNRWIDAYPNLGKETGGYSSGCSGPHPYVKMNWGGKLLDFYTLVHELGHYVHASKIIENQPYIYQDYPPFISEVASTTAENISQFYLIQHAESKEEKQYYIEQYLDNLVLMVFNSTMMAEFELEIHKMIETGNPLSTEMLNDLYGKLLKQYYGDEVTITKIDEASWLEWPHFYLNYYLYSYATSFSASIQLATNILNEGKPAIQRFNKLLEAGNSALPVEILKTAGVDMMETAPYEAVAEKMNALMDELMIGIE